MKVVKKPATKARGEPVHWSEDDVQGKTGQQGPRAAAQEPQEHGELIDPWN
jgi:hypothetical protein